MTHIYSIFLLFTVFSISAFSQTFSLEQAEKKKVNTLTKILDENFDLEPKKLPIALSSLLASSALDSHVGVLNDQNFTHKEVKDSIIRVLHKLNVRQLHLLLHMQTVEESRHKQQLEDQDEDYVDKSKTLEDFNTITWAGRGVEIQYKRQLISSIIEIKLSRRCINLLSST